MANFGTVICQLNCPPRWDIGDVPLSSCGSVLEEAILFNNPVWEGNLKTKFYFFPNFSLQEAVFLWKISISFIRWHVLFVIPFFANYHPYCIFKFLPPAPPAPEVLNISALFLMHIYHLRRTEVGWNTRRTSWLVFFQFLLHWLKNVIVESFSVTWHRLR